MKLLLHACCGPCACYPTEKLTADGIDFDIIFFNPNIHPYKEFKTPHSRPARTVRKEKIPFNS